MEPVPALPCPGCGAALPVDPTRAEVTCSYCVRSTPVPPALQARARAHVERMRSLWAKELESRWMELVHRRTSRINRPLIAVIVLFACSVPAWMIALGTKLLTHVSLATQIFLVAAELALFAALVHFFRVMVSPPSVQLVLTSGLGGCTTCGGPIRFEEGATHTGCAYCGATALSTPDMHRRFLQTAMARLGGALTDRERAVLANFDSAQSVRVRGMEVPIAPVAVAFSIVAAFAMTGGIVVAGVRGARVTDGGTPTGSIVPTLLVACLGLLFWGVHGVQQGIAGRKRFEQALGRAMSPAAFAAAGAPRGSGRT